MLFLVLLHRFVPFRSRFRPLSARLLVGLTRDTHARATLGRAGRAGRAGRPAVDDEEGAGAALDGGDPAELLRVEREKNAVLRRNLKRLKTSVRDADLLVKLVEKQEEGRHSPLFAAVRARRGRRVVLMQCASWLCAGAART